MIYRSIVLYLLTLIGGVVSGAVMTFLFVHPAPRAMPNGPLRADFARQEADSARLCSSELNQMLLGRGLPGFAEQ